MNKMKFVLLIFIFTFGVNLTYSQICGAIIFTVLDKKNRTIPVEKYKITEVDKHFLDDNRIGITENGRYIQICGEYILNFTIEYKGKKMRLQVRLGNGFGFSKGKIKFEKGNFVVERGYAEQDSGLKVRKATEEDLENK